MWEEHVGVTDDGTRFVYHVEFYENVAFRYVGRTTDSVSQVQEDGRAMFAGGLKRWFDENKRAHL